MSKTHRRSRQRRGKLSRRMKKRGGGPKSSLNSSLSTSASKRNVSISSIIDRKIRGRASFFEGDNKVFKPALNNQPTRYTKTSQYTIFTIPTPAGLTEFTVDTNLDEAAQHKALDRFNIKFRNIQDYFIDMLNKSMLGEAQGHNGQWICVTVGDGVWNPRTGSWKMLPEKVNRDEKVNDAFLQSSDGKAMILRKNYAGIFCLPENYKLLMRVPLGVPVIM